MMLATRKLQSSKGLPLVYSLRCADIFPQWFLVRHSRNIFPNMEAQLKTVAHGFGIVIGFTGITDAAT